MDPTSQNNESVSMEEEYRSRVARGIAAASGAVAMGILCCGDISVAALTRGFRFLHLHTSTHNNNNKKRENKRKSRAVTRGIHWANKLAKAAEALAALILAWMISLTRSVARLILVSKPANWIINFLPEDVVLATLQSFNKIYDAVEVSRNKVVSTFSGCTKEFVRERYGDNAGSAAEEGIEALGHAIGAVTAVSSIPAAVHPKNAISPSSFARLAHTNIRNKDT